MANHKIKRTEEHKQKIRDALKKHYESDINRSKHSKKMSEVWKTNDNAKKMNSHESSVKRGKTLSDMWVAGKFDDVKLQRQDVKWKDRSKNSAKKQWENNREEMIKSFRLRELKHLSKETIDNLHNADWLIKENETKSLTIMSSEIGISDVHLRNHFLRLGVDIKYHNYTGGEDLIIEFIKSIDPNIIIERRTRKVISPLEIDIYLPQYKLGIEYSGVWWHSYNKLESTIERRKHYNKAQIASDNGVRLLQFWDFEWHEKTEICKSIIRTALGKNVNRIGARECIIDNISFSEIREFLEKNHIQGSASASFYIGLKHPITNELLVVMSIGKSRFKKNAWEIIRIATKIGWSVSGGIQRLWYNIIPKIGVGISILSYADRRLFGGGVYKILGFKKIHSTLPGYNYLKNGIIFSRLQFQKHKLGKELDNYNSDVSEAENMFNNGYRRLWDAGQDVWEYVVNDPNSI